MFPLSLRCQEKAVAFLKRRLLMQMEYANLGALSGFQVCGQVDIGTLE
jgi:hypothetical protein